ncbi:D-amino acid dehydrogenase [Oceanisphaera avium]|uniref:D-amino acid dehydrogenase n=1 Tax=Oceanisphaera avium TaxID=1903694 RepID=A0A1Y0CWJ7_9GAMM|nr:D-amino acid dehydrogenase [Oceanisphaera avium]ART79235.1 D-amino acid dehydrogenase small subunit [Oceanisphaera avium]
MKILVLGSGIVGVTSAWYLAQQGHEVVVLDRQSEAGVETSFANAGQLSFGMSSPWAAPGIPKKAIKWLFQAHAPLKIRPSLNPAQWQFMMAMLANCTHNAYVINKSRMVRISEYSRHCINQLQDELQLPFEARQQGLLQVFKSQQQIDDAAKDIKVLQEFNVRHQLLNVQECIAQEPALAQVKHTLAGGLYFPDDQTGDCHLFTQALSQRCQALGVSFKFNTDIQALLSEGDRIKAVQTSHGLEVADQVLVCLGSYSPLLLSPLGIRLPVYPIKGYSLTMAVQNDAAAPQSTVMDETYKVAITRFDNRVRAAGTAELADFNADLPRARRATIAESVASLFPEAGELSRAEFWTGFRPMTPDGTPIIGGTRYQNLWLNTGHGTLGWTMGAGSAKLIADLITGNPPEIDPSGLAINRYR